MIATATQIQIGDDGLVRIDGIPAFRRVERSGVVYLEFFDRDRMRAQCRGSKFVEIPLNTIVSEMDTKENTKMENELTFFVAYRKGADDKYNYLGDGKGNIRLFKTQEAIDKFLDEIIPAEMRPTVFTHSITGEFVLPEPAPNEPVLMPISTLAGTMTPTAMELLENRKRRNGK